MAGVWIRHMRRFIDAAGNDLWTWREDLSLYGGGEGCYSAHDWGALSEVVRLEQEARCGLSK